MLPGCDDSYVDLVCMPFSMISWLQTAGRLASILRLKLDTFLIHTATLIQTSTSKCKWFLLIIMLMIPPHLPTLFERSWSQPNGRDSQKVYLTHELALKTPN